MQVNDSMKYKSPAIKTTGKNKMNSPHIPAMFKFAFALIVLLQVPFFVTSQLYNGGPLRNEVTSDLIEYEP